MAEKRGSKSAKSNKKRNVAVETTGQVHIKASFNNILISITNMAGQVISWSSSGKMGFRGSKKNTPYAAQVAAADCGKVAHDLGMRKLEAHVKGPGSGRDAAIRSLQATGFEITNIINKTPLPHNGCRPHKRRRV